MVFDLWSGLVFETSCEKSKKCPGVMKSSFFTKTVITWLDLCFRKIIGSSMVANLREEKKK